VVSYSIITPEHYDSEFCGEGGFANSHDRLQIFGNIFQLLEEAIDVYQVVAQQTSKLVSKFVLGGYPQAKGNIVARFDPLGQLEFRPTLCALREATQLINLTP
jgi:hypothetical protein